jgi:energy-coupling factor transporter ATP-binding protein EcfA2
MTSRLNQARQAVRPALKARMMLAGPPGAGKTRCSLIIAQVLAEGGSVLGIDTEKESMLTYAEDFTFDHLPWQPPFDPRELSETLLEADGYSVVIVDSLTHFWRGDGGTMSIANGRFTGWKEARPVQEELVEAILSCSAHVVLGVRSKVEYTQEQESNGKQVVRKLGMAAQQDGDLEFELNVAVDLAMDHTATISKSRTTALPVGRTFKGSQMADMAGLYRDWLAAGEPPAKAADVTALIGRMQGLPEKLRKECKQAFFAAFGKPEQLRESQVEQAGVLVDSYEQTADPTEVEPADAGLPFEEASV